MPKVGRTLGMVVREFRRASRGMTDELGLDGWHRGGSDDEHRREGGREHHPSGAG